MQVGMCLKQEADAERASSMGNSHSSIARRLLVVWGEGTCIGGGGGVCVCVQMPSNYGASELLNSRQY